MAAIQIDRRAAAPRPVSRVLHAAASAVMLAAWAIAVSLCVAIGVMGAADLAGVDVRVPKPGPMPAPLVAPAGLDR